MSLIQQAKKGIIVLGGTVVPDYHGEIVLLFYNAGKEEHVQSAGYSLGCLLVLPCPVIKVFVTLYSRQDGKGHRAFQEWVSPPGEEPRPVEVLAGSGGGAERRVRSLDRERAHGF